MSVDPLTKSFPHYSPYQFAGNKPIVAVDLDGMEELVIHSAFWTQKFLEMDLPTMTASEIIDEVNRINLKGYEGVNERDYNNQEHAIRNYESEGDVVSAVREKGPLTLTGYTNANSGDVIKFTIYSIADGQGALELTIIEPGPVGTTLDRAVNGTITYFIKHTPFGKLGRALENEATGIDPLTGEQGSTSKLVIGGLTNFVTMGFGVGSAATNIGLNVFQDVLESSNPEHLEEMGIGREALDIGISVLLEENPVKAIEIMGNMIEGGLITDDLIEKHSQPDTTKTNEKGN